MEEPFGVNAVSLRAVHIYDGSYDPSTVGLTAPIGSHYLRSDGNLYVKIGSSFTDWEIRNGSSLKNISADYTLKINDLTAVADTSAGNIILTLPQGPYLGKQFIIRKKSSLNVLTITPFFGETVNGTSVLALTDDTTVMLIFTETGNWTVLGGGSSEVSDINTYVIADSADATVGTSYGQYLISDSSFFLNSAEAMYDTELLIAVKTDGVFSDAKDTASRLNVYEETGVLKIQNKTGTSKTLKVRKLI